MGKVASTFTPAVVVAALIAFALSAIATVEVLYLFHELNTGFAMIGSILGFAALSLVFFAPFIHKLSDRMGYGLFLVWSCLLLACAAVGAALAFSAGMYAVPKVVLALLSPVVVPLVIELVREVFRFAKDLDRLLIILTTSISFAAAAGAVSAGVVAQTVGYAYVYVLCAIMFFLAGMAALFLPQTTPPRAFTKLPTNPVLRLSPVLKKPFFLLVLIAFSLQAYWAVRDIVLPFVITQSGGSVFHVGLVFGGMSVAAGVGSLVARRLLYKNDPRRVLVVVLGVAAVFALLLPFGPLLMLGLVASGFSLFESSASPSVSEAVDGAAPKRSAHTIFEGLRLVSALAWVVTPIALGILLEAGMPARMVLFFAGLGMLYVYVRVQREFSPEDIFPRLSVKKRKRLSW